MFESLGVSKQGEFTVTGPRITELMADKEIVAYAYRCARRYAKISEDRQEFVQDAFLRLRKDRFSDETPIFSILDEIRRGVHAAYERRRREKSVQNRFLHGYIDDEETVELGRGRRLAKKAIRLSPWYYDKEWLEYNARNENGEMAPLGKWQVPRRLFHRIYLGDGNWQTNTQMSPWDKCEVGK